MITPADSIAFDQNRLEPPLKQVSDQTVASVERLGINTVELSNTLRQVRIRRLHHEVVMGDHLAVGVGTPVAAGTDLFQQQWVLEYKN